MAERVEEFKEQKSLCMSWFDLCHDGPMYGGCQDMNEDLFDFEAHYAVPRFRLVDFGSTRLSVESASSDLDLLITTFDCLFERIRFFTKLEAKMK